MDFVTATRNLPGGLILGWVMVLCTVLSPVGDLLVSGLVKTVHVQSRCPFDKGLVLSTTPLNAFSVVPVNGKPYTVSSNAQLTSVQNGGLSGIYFKVNSDTDFSAETQDVLGSWDCADVQDDIPYSIDHARSDVLEDLISRQYLYTNSIWEATNKKTEFTHLVAWSSSVDDGANTPFDIRASIDLTANETDAKIMKSFHCTIDTSQVDLIMSQIEIVSTLNQWVPVLQGAMYDGSGTNASSNANVIIEQMLNSMIMAEGGSNNLLHKPTGDTSQGFLASRTSLPVGIIVLSTLVGIIFLVRAGYWIFLALAIRSAEFQIFTELSVNIPSGLVLWMLQATRESTLLNGNAHLPQPRPADLVEWKYNSNGRLQEHTGEYNELVDRGEGQPDEGN